MQPISAVAPVVAGEDENVNDVPSKPEPIQAQYELAAQSRDPVAMMEIARKTLGTPISDAAVESAKVIQKNGEQFDSLVKPVEQAGGLQTPEGRLKAADTWKTVKDHPQWGSFLIESLLGNPNARLQATGGTIKSQITFDDSGRMVRVDTNELGQIANAVDLETQKQINPKEFSQRKAGQSSLENTLARKAQVINNKAFAENFAANQIAEGEWGAASGELHDLYDQKKKMLGQLYGSGLNNKQLEELASFSSRQVGTSQSISDGFNALDQYSKSKGVGMDETQKKKAQAAATILGLTLNGQGELVNGKNEKVDRSALNNLQQNYSKNNGYEQNYNQTKEDVAKSMVYRNLGLKEKQIFDSILEIDRNIERKTSELTSKYGTPSFLVTPSAMGVADQFARAEVQAEMGKFNSAAIRTYNDWKQDKIAEFERNGQVPTPGELQRAFQKSEVYKNLREQYMNESMNIRRRVVEATPERENETIQPSGVKPPPEGKSATGGKAPPKPTEQGDLEERRAALRAKHRQP